MDIRQDKVGIYKKKGKEIFKKLTADENRIHSTKAKWMGNTLPFRLQWSSSLDIVHMGWKAKNPAYSEILGLKFSKEVETVLLYLKLIQSLILKNFGAKGRKPIVFVFV